MKTEVETHIAAVEALYKPLMAGSKSPLKGGAKLWAQFESAADSCRNDKPGAILGLIERVNELAVARLIMIDPALEGTLHYEPKIIPDNRRIDFVIVGASENTYIEVKTVHPQAKDSEENWQKHLDRQELHPKNVHQIFSQEWMGAQFAVNSFSARAHFLDYACQFETRLAAAKAVRAGRGILAFCGTGFAWHRSELEDFVDFYLTGIHRTDDPYGPMEAHGLRSKKVTLQRNISDFAFIKRGVQRAKPEQCIMPVRGSRMP